MPQKPIYSRPPLISVPYCFPSAGTIRTEDERILRLYESAGRYSDSPCLWEGLFRIACLIKNDPLSEPVTGLILKASEETENGAFGGSISDQISIARAVMAVFEYNTDRTLLRRIAAWLRYVEIEFDRLSLEDELLYRPADLMELMVRFYLAAGSKAVLRLCTRLRTAAFDWTTVLHTFQQSIPISRNGTVSDPVLKCPPDELDYVEKEKLINHAEMLADGMRFSLMCGIFSGHGQDLSAGKSGWQYLLKHHHAICGGTTASPFLSGSSPDQPVSTAAVCAWAEALASQLMLSGSDWALDEMIRIIYNGLEDCLNREILISSQHVNSLGDETEEQNPARLYGRLTRAASCAFQHMITITQDGIRINYRLSGRIMTMIRKQQVILQTEEDKILFRSKREFEGIAEIYLSGTASAVIATTRHGETVREPYRDSGGWLKVNGSWQDGDGFVLKDDGRIYPVDAHHQGICFIERDRLLCLPADRKQYAYAVDEPPVKENGKTVIHIGITDKWLLKNGRPGDIPVLPGKSRNAQNTEMQPYSACKARITMFPRIKNACLK